MTARALTALTPVLEAEKPDLVIAQGDTTTTFVASLAAFYVRGATSGTSRRGYAPTRSSIRSRKR